MQQQRPRDFERILAAVKYARNVALDQLADSEGYIAILENQVQRMNAVITERDKTIAELRVKIADMESASPPQVKDAE